MVLSVGGRRQAHGVVESGLGGSIEAGLGASGCQTLTSDSLIISNRLWPISIHSEYEEQGGASYQAFQSARAAASLLCLL